MSERHTLAAAVDLGRSLSHASILRTETGKVCDLLQIQRLLREVCIDGSSRARKSIVLDEALAPLDRDESVHTSFGLLSSLRDEQLKSLGRGGLLALRDAVSLAEPWAAEFNLARLDAELARRGNIQVRHVAGVTILGDDVQPLAMELVVARLNQMIGSRPRAAAAMKGMFILLVPEAERRADNELLFAHLKISAKRSFDGRLWELLRDTAPTEVISIAEEGVLADTEAVTSLSRLSELAASTRRVLGLKPPFKKPVEPPIALWNSVRGPS